MVHRVVSVDASPEHPATGAIKGFTRRNTGNCQRNCSFFNRFPLSSTLVDGFEFKDIRQSVRAWRLFSCKRRGAHCRPSNPARLRRIGSLALPLGAEESAEPCLLFSTAKTGVSPSARGQQQFLGGQDLAQIFYMSFRRRTSPEIRWNAAPNPISLRSSASFSTLTSPEVIRTHGRPSVQEYRLRLKRP